MQWQIFGFLLVAGLCLAEIELPNHPNSLDDVPAVKEKCEKNGKADTYERLKTAINDTRTCLTEKINPTQIKDELEEAKKTGSMDEVFGKYCNKRQEYKDCLLKTVNVSKECLEETEINALNAAIRVIEEVADFACYRDGDRLAMFVAEGGTKCVSSRTEQIQKCVNSTLKIDTSSFSFTSLPTALPSLGIDKQKCDALAEIQQCIVSDLENNCEETTPANIVDALFKFVKKSTCKNIKTKRSKYSERIKRNAELHALKMINSSSLHQKFAEECQRNGGEQAFNEFWKAVHYAQSCLEKNRIFATTKDEYLNNLKNCTTDPIKKIEDCLREDMKFYPSFIVEAMGSLIKFAYEFLNLNKLTPKSDILFCLQRIKSVSEIKKNVFPDCIQKHTPNQSGIHNYSLPDKETVCTLLKDVDDCFNSFVRRTCAPDIVVDRFLGNLTEAIHKPCKN